MSLFTGRAWFSPRVPMSVRKAWVTHGGSVAGVSSEDYNHAIYLFCDGNDDPWFSKLYQRSIAVFHWLWISAVVNARFRVPISMYAIEVSADSGETDTSAPAYMRCLHPESLAERTTKRRSPPQHDTVTSRARPLRARLYAPRIQSEDEVSDPDTPVPKARTKKPSAPFMDLRSLQTARMVSHTKCLKSVRLLAPYNPERRKRQALSSGNEKDAPTFSALVSQAATSGLSVKAISVSAALESLSGISMERATQFVPGAIHLGKEFTCFYVQ
ncbi:hypothetical protein BV20DRAFT_777715 [Pilatotrama ljubarskyi]|nr:hypothetical protein BV20DRAFT_777715 [Pilatotrama ljubarskyi]